MLKFLERRKGRRCFQTAMPADGQIAAHCCNGDVGPSRPEGQLSTLYAMLLAGERDHHLRPVFPGSHPGAFQRVIVQNDTHETLSMRSTLS
jgi:hypothetical protein